jgi:tRNA (mo5U34)-methyltransferase
VITHKSRDIDSLDYSALIARLQGTRLQPLADALPTLAKENFNRERWGDIPRWLQCVQQLPAIALENIFLDCDAVSLTSAAALSAETKMQLHTALRGLHPWRKGPFDIFGTAINTEWRSDWKWQRIAPHLHDLRGKTVLDVGCGSGYHCWRMLGAGADLVIGIDPSPLFVVQYLALQHYIKSNSVFVVPAGCENLPADLQAFDTVFSMGVLYHRRSPMDHLLELRQLLKPGGQLVLETLVIEGDETAVLLPRERYARMGNVWFIPSVAAIKCWLEKLRFKDVQIVDVCPTTTEEQRSTEWMTFQSLQDFLDPQDHTKTIEGYPAPRRAVLTATAP